MNNVIKNCETIRETAKGIAKKIIVFSLLFCLNLSIFAQSCMQKKANISVQNVEVLIDNIFEEGISLQILGMAKKLFDSQISIEETNIGEECQNFSLKINLRERSFYKSIDNIHSLYASYQLFSEDGNCVLENVFCSEGKKSILSALVQQKQVEKIVRDIKKYFENGNKKDA